MPRSVRCRRAYGGLAHRARPNWPAESRPAVSDPAMKPGNLRAAASRPQRSVHYNAGAPVYFVTAFSYGPVTPLPDAPRAPYISYNLHPKDFVRLVRKHGTDKILFGTDSPWENQQDYVKRISHMDFTKEELEQILSENAKKLFTI